MNAGIFTITEHPPYQSYRPLPSKLRYLRYLGWPIDPDRRDEGLDDWVSTALVKALTECGNVAFLHSASSTTGGKWAMVAPSTWETATRHGPLGFGRLWGLRFSRDPNLVRELFEDDEYSWHLRGQLALLYRPETEPESLDAGAIARCIDEQDITPLADCIGYLRPGDDGDFGELGMSGSEDLDRVIAALQGDTAAPD
jgi:hypothetical protein